jgi:hypothetical protein
MSLDGESEPQNIQEAMNSKYWPEWLSAIHQELASLKAMNVYQEIDELPVSKKAVGSKWVLMIKRDKNGEISRFKAHFIAQGFTQIPGQDFMHTFTPVAHWDSIRFILSIATMNDWEICHIDIKTAYLNGVLDEEIYLRRPSILGPDYWLLQKALYGLRQSGWQWYFKMARTYKGMGMIKCELDWSVHYRKDGLNTSMTATSVDDIVLAMSSMDEADQFTDQIKAKYVITNNGDISWLLGCRIT